eukprot:3787050-Prymnesium_polylepis.1
MCHGVESERHSLTLRTFPYRTEPLPWTTSFSGSVRDPARSSDPARSPAISCDLLRSPVISAIRPTLLPFGAVSPLKVQYTSTGLARMASCVTS